MFSDGINNYDDPSHINIGSGEEYSILELANIVKSIVGYEGELIWDTSKPNGTPRRKLDISKLSQLGWSASTRLTEGLGITYKWYLENNV